MNTEYPASGALSLFRKFIPLALLCLSMASLAADDDVSLNKQTWWFGNSFPGGNGGTEHWMMQGVDDLAVQGGRLYPIVEWDEHGGESNIYSAASGDHLIKPPGWHSWGWSGGPAVATDDRYVYYSMGHNGRDGGGLTFAGVARYTLDGKPAAWPEANSGHRLVVNDDPRPKIDPNLVGDARRVAGIAASHKPTGLAVYGGELFVSDPGRDRIAVFTTRDMKLARTFAFSHPGRIVVDTTPEHALWVIDFQANTVRRISRDGADLHARIDDCLQPAAMALTPEGDLLVADADQTRQRIQRYKLPAGTRVAGADFGGPVYQGLNPGAVVPGRFFRIKGIACDSDGSLYVGCWDFGGKIWKFDKQRNLVWVRQGTEFLGCGDADPGADTNVYSLGHRYEIDYGKPPGAGWRDAAITLDPIRCPDDPRIWRTNIAVKMLRINGQRIMVGIPQMGGAVYIWRFDGDIAIPAAIYCPGSSKDVYPPNHPKGPYLWIDRNGDGRMQADEYLACPAGSSAVMIDERGDIVVNLGGWTTGDWKAGKGSIAIIPCTGLDQHGVPGWDLAKTITKPIPTDGGLQYLSHLSYDADNDRMYIGAWTNDHPNPQPNAWQQLRCGSVLLRFDHWSQNPTLAWRTVIAPEKIFSREVAPKAWTFENDYAFVGYTRTSVQTAVDVYQLSDGKRVGRLVPTAEVGKVSGWLDMTDGIQSHRRADGSYVVFLEEDWAAKNLYWLWKPETFGR